jgi:glutathione S-transferase
MKLHDYPASQNAWKVRTLLQHLGITYESVNVAIFRGESHTPEFLTRNPAGAVPVLEPEPGKFIAESNAILCYLAEGTRYFAGDRENRAKILQWLFFEQSYVEPTIGSLRYWRLTGKYERRKAEAPARERMATGALEALNRELTRRPYLADDYSIADIAVFAYSHLAEDAGFDLAPYPAFRRWIEHIKNEKGPLPPVVLYSADPDSSRDL